jgi:hypothetical protein
LYRLKKFWRDAGREGNRSRCTVALLDEADYAGVIKALASTGAIAMFAPYTFA